MAACPVWLPVLAFSVLTVASASLQAVVFKLTGYVLGPFPYFILLCVSFAFVPIFFSGVFCIERYAKIAPAARASPRSVVIAGGLPAEVPLREEAAEDLGLGLRKHVLDVLLCHHLLAALRQHAHLLAQRAP